VCFIHAQLLWFPLSHSHAVQIANVSIEKSSSPNITRFPGAPFLVGAGCVLISLFVAFTLPGMYGT
jgi:hypothetical protein